MATREIKMPVKDNSEQEVEEMFSQREPPERGRYLLQVDRQTKANLPAATDLRTLAATINVRGIDAVINDTCTIG